MRYERPFRELFLFGLVVVGLLAHQAGGLFVDSCGAGALTGAAAAECSEIASEICRVVADSVGGAAGTLGFGAAAVSVLAGGTGGGGGVFAPRAASPVSRPSLGRRLVAGGPPRPTPLPDSAAPLREPLRARPRHPALH